MAAFGVVYLIVNMVNGRKYVEQTIQPLRRRFCSHASSKKSLIGKAIREYGRENFRYGVIVTCSSKAELDEKEKFFIATLKTKEPIGYNRTDGGEKTFVYVRTDETLKKLAASQTGKHHTLATCAKIAETLDGVPKSPKHCAAISAGRRGKFVGEKNHRFGKHHTKSTCYAISANQRGETPYKNLIAELDAHRLSCAALAKLMGFASMSSISDKMHGRKNFTARDAAKLEEIFGKPAEYLLQRDEEFNLKNSDTKILTSPFKNLVVELNIHHLSYTALAKILGLTLPNVSAKMRGKLRFTARDAAKLEEIFGKPSTYLLQRTEA